MKGYVTAFAVAAACTFAVPAIAQDTTTTSKTKVDADDAKAVKMTGCLQAADASGAFTLTNAKMAAGDDLESKTKTEVDVDEDETEVETKTETEIDRDDDDEAVGTAGSVTTYQLMPKDGVNLTPHVGHTVEIMAVAVEKKSATDDDAEVEVETETKVEREDAPDSKVKSKTEAEIPRGAQRRLTVMSVKHVSPSCSM